MSPNLPNLSFNLNTALYFALIIVPFFGVLLGESRLKRLIFAIFVGMAVSEALSSALYKFVSHYNVSFITEERVGFALFAASVVLLNVGPMSHSTTSKRFSVRVFVLAILMTTLLLSTTMLFLPEGTKQAALNNSIILSFLNSTRYIWIGASAAWVIILNLWPAHDPKKK